MKKKALFTVIAGVMLGAACMGFAACGDSDDDDMSAVYAAVANTYLGYLNNTTDELGYQMTDVWNTELTLGSDGSYEVTATGTYTAAETSSEGVYTVTLAEATALTGTMSLINDAVLDRSYTEYDIDLEYCSGLTYGDAAYALTAFYGERTFTLDTTVDADSYESFEDPLFEDVYGLYYIAACREDKGLYDTY